MRICDVTLLQYLQHGGERMTPLMSYKCVRVLNRFQLLIFGLLEQTLQRKNKAVCNIHLSLKGESPVGLHRVSAAQSGRSHAQQ